MKATHSSALTILAITLFASIPSLSRAEDAEDQLLRICQKEQFAITPAMRSAYLTQAKKQAVDRLAATGKPLSPEFLAWVDSDMDIATGVYAAHHQPEDVLLWLYSLRLDLGKEKFEKYHQLALATALVCAKEGMVAN